MKNASADGFLASYRAPANAQGANANVVISAMNCMPMICPELTAASWKKNEDNLKMKLSQALKDNPALVFDIADATVDGKPAVSVYALSFVSTTDATGTSRASTHAYDIYWHDGARFVTVGVNAGATGAQSLEEFVQKMPKADLEALAKKALGVVLAEL